MALLALKMQTRVTAKLALFPLKNRVISELRLPVSKFWHFHPDLRQLPIESVVTWFDRHTQAFCLRKYTTMCCHPNKNPSTMFHDDFDDISKEALVRAPEAPRGSVAEFSV